MKDSKIALWDRFQKYYTEFPTLGLSIDLSRVGFPDDFFQRMEAPLQRAYISMAALELGDIANPDEKRMVGHYWLRAPQLAPTHSIRDEISRTLESIKSFAQDVHEARFIGAGGPFQNVLVIGIGGSALGPQFVARALGRPGADRLRPFFFDNTDPDGMDRTLAEITAATGGSVTRALGVTLCVVISKSGGTPETRNGMLEAEAAYGRAGLKFAEHAVAVTQEGSAMDKYAKQGQWRRFFPMWDWVGGRTSETSAVGLLPAALQGLDIDAFLAGAKACDEITRKPETAQNPAAQLAAMWFYLGEGRGSKDMVVLPYKDRLELFSKYLQQLIMESLGKELDLDGRIVNQGISVYGNKGSTDQHAYVQQLREGVLNFFAVFIEVLKDREGTPVDVEHHKTTELPITSGDFLTGFYLGTRDALFEKGRQSITLTVRDCSAFTVGVLIALFERAVGLYASLVHINAYHQPGVEAGKKAAAGILDLQARAVAQLKADPSKRWTATALSERLGTPGSAESVFLILRHLAANGRHAQSVGGQGTSTEFQAL